MKKTLKQFITEHNEANNWSTDKESLFETFEEVFDTVHTGEADKHRWYTNYDIVKEVEIDGEKRYFSWYEMTVHSESSSREDCGYEIPDLDDIDEVYPKETVVITYTSEKP
jgi:hypothetical protein